MSELPTGTVTLMFTDIEGSTRLLQQLGVEYEQLLSAHHSIMREAISGAAGVEVDTQGDAFFAAFRSAKSGLDAAVTAQRALASHSWPQGAQVRVRMGLHTGEPLPVGDSYVGIDVHRAARICSAGHGGQIIMSASTRSMLVETSPASVDFLDLGEHRLKDLERPERIFQVTGAGLAETFPPLKSLEVPSNLPSLPTPFVGRTELLGQLHRLLRDPAVPLVTVSGPGGAGKTRLAIQAASNLLDDFPDGVFLVPLAALTDPELVVPAIGYALGVRESPGLSMRESVEERLAGKQLLLLLDNFENVAGAAPAIGALLAQARKLTVLVTSRAVLRLSGERELHVPPMELPQLERAPTAEELSQYEAVQLFIQRARAARPSFSVTNENAPAVAEICARLDGLPLAIELAAARIRLLSPQAMLKRLESRLDLLTGGASDLPARQQTLRRTVEWSYDLLGEPEKQLFRRLSVFVRSRSLEAIEAVCAADGADVLDPLTSLVEQSLLGLLEADAEEPRYTMLESIREYAAERLQESGESDTIRLAHARYYADLVEGGEVGLQQGMDQQGWFERLEAEHDNIRVALRWLFERTDDLPRLELAYRIAAGAGWFWYTHGHLREGSQWLEAALSVDAPLPKPLRARALHALGVLADERRQPDRAIACFEEALAIHRSVGDDKGVAAALNGLAIVATGSGDQQRAKTLFEESLAIRRRLGEQARIAGPLTNLGVVAAALGDYPRARELFEESLKIDRSAGNDWGIGVNLTNLSGVSLDEGHTERAVQQLVEAITVLRQIGDTDALQDSVDEAALIAASKGEPALAVRLATAAESARETLGTATTGPEGERRARYLQPAEAMLPPEDLERAQAEGRQMLIDQAVTYALSSLKQGSGIGV